MALPDQIIWLHGVRHVNLLFLEDIDGQGLKAFKSLCRTIGSDPHPPTKEISSNMVRGIEWS